VVDRDLLDNPKPRRFQLVRHADATGQSGTGIVAEGIRFRDGRAAYRWTTNPRTTQVADSVQDITAIHSHGGKTNLRYMDGQEKRGQSKDLAETYQDRNRLAVAFASIADRIPSLAAGWHAPTDADDADADAWATVWAELPTGQVSWHVPRSLVDDARLPERLIEYDGHDRVEKNHRLMRSVAKSTE
jgi:hypothetical protein